MLRGRGEPRGADAPTPPASSGLFAYGAPGAPGERIEAPFAGVAIAATGLAPTSSDRIVEIAVVRVTRAGQVVDAWSTVVNPQRDAGPSSVHGVELRHVGGAPRFGHVAGDVLSRLAGAVVVAHDAPLVEVFLRAELDRAGIAVGPFPALCTLLLTEQLAGRLANPHLATAANRLGLRLDPGQPRRVAEAQLAAQLAAALVARSTPLGFAATPVTISPVPASGRHAPGPTARPPAAVTPPSVALDPATHPAARAYGVAVLDALAVAPSPAALGDLTRLAAHARLERPQLDALHRAAIHGAWAELARRREVTVDDARAYQAAARLWGALDVANADPATAARPAGTGAAAAVDSVGATAQATITTADGVRRRGVASEPGGRAEAVEGRVVSSPRAGWYRDPLGRHELRWWNGSAWTVKAASNGAVVDDPHPSLGP